MAYLAQARRSWLCQRWRVQRSALLYALVLGVGLALFVVGNTREGLWLDESYSAAMVRLTPVQILRAVVSDNHPPLYYLALWLFVAALGHSVFTLRLFSALGALGLAALGVGPIQRATSPTAGRLYTCLVIATPGVLAEAQEVRMYAWAACFVTASVVYAFLAARDNRRRDWVLCGLFSVAAAYTHYYALLAVGIIYGLLGVGLAWRGRDRLRRYLVTGSLVGLAYLPWLIPLARQSRRAVGSFWIDEITAQTVRDSLLFPFGYKWGSVSPSLPTLLAFGLVAGLGLGGAVYAVRRRLPARGLLGLSLGVFSLLLASIVVVSYAMRPVLSPRYMSILMGLLLLPAAYGLSLLPRLRYRWLGCAAFLVMMAPLLVQTQRELFNGPWPAVVEALSVQAEPNAVFVHASLHTLGPLAYYFPQATHILYQPSLTQRQPMSFFGPHVWFDPAPQQVAQTELVVWVVGCNLSECDGLDDLLASGQLGSLQTSQEFHQPASWLRLSLTRVAPRRP